MKTRYSLILLLIIITCAVQLNSKSILLNPKSYRHFNKDIKLELKVVELPLEYLEDIKGTSNSNRIKRKSGLSRYSMTRLWNEARKEGSSVKVVSSHDLMLNGILAGHLEGGISYSYINKYDAQLSGLVPVIKKLYSGFYGAFQIMDLNAGGIKKDASALLSWSVLNCRNGISRSSSGNQREGFFRTTEFSGNEIDLPKVKGFSAASNFIVKDGEIRLLFSCSKNSGSLQDTIMTAIFIRTSFISNSKKPTYKKHTKQADHDKLNEKHRKSMSLFNLYDHRNNVVKFKKNKVSFKQNRTIMLSGKIIDVSSEMMSKLKRYINASTFLLSDSGLRILSESVRKKESFLLDAFDITGTKYTEMNFISGTQTSYIASFKTFSKKFESLYRIGNIPVVKNMFSGLLFNSNNSSRKNDPGINISGNIIRKSDLVFHKSEVKYQSVFANQESDDKIERKIHSSKIEKPEIRTAPIVFNNRNVPLEKTSILIGPSRRSGGLERNEKRELRNEIILFRISDR
ncbi:hypothetical protein KAJ27_05310 [bacterium]|nr:hypothetical protein [bacterium]